MVVEQRAPEIEYHDPGFREFRGQHYIGPYSAVCHVRDVLRPEKYSFLTAFLGKVRFELQCCMVHAP